MIVRWPMLLGIVFLCLVCSLGAQKAHAQRAIPRTTWDEKTADPSPEIPLQTIPTDEQVDSQIAKRTQNAKAAAGNVPADLQALFDGAQQSRSVCCPQTIAKVHWDRQRIVQEGTKLRH
jgi:hypothetical protein